MLEHLNRDHQEAGVETIRNEGLQKNQREGRKFMENAAAEMWGPPPARQASSGFTLLLESYCLVWEFKKKKWQFYFCLK